VCLCSSEGGVPFLWLRLFQTGEGCFCEERILPEGQPPVDLLTRGVCVTSPVRGVCVCVLQSLVLVSRLPYPHLCVCVCVLQSLVLVSRLPYPHLFHSLLQIVAPEFFEKLAPCLEAGDDVMLCHQHGPVRGMTHDDVMLCHQRGPVRGMNDVFLSSSVCNGIDQWPSPAPGLTLNLPVMGVVLQVRRRKRRGHTGDFQGAFH